MVVQEAGTPEDKRTCKECFYQYSFEFPECPKCVVLNEPTEPDPVEIAKLINDYNNRRSTINKDIKDFSESIESLRSEIDQNDIILAKKVRKIHSTMYSVHTFYNTGNSKRTRTLSKKEMDEIIERERKVSKNAKSVTTPTSELHDGDLLEVFLQ